MVKGYRESLLIQIREAYGRLVYTYTCYNKETNILSDRLRCLKKWQIILSSLTTGGLLSAITVEEKWITIVSCVLSTISTCISLYLKNNNISNQINSFRFASDDAWIIREDYVSLLTDFDQLDDKDIVEKRDDLKNRVYALYKKYPKTDSESYKQAQKALKEDEEQFFKAEEIDQMLPEHLRIGKSSKQEN